jgi:nucleotide-binding universal stress UspA family protein
MPTPADIDPDHRDHAREMFEQSRVGGAPACSWDELHGEPVTGAFVQRALMADLVVLGQRDPKDAAGFDVPVDFVEAVVIESGRPALVVPYTGAVSATPATVLIAWKSTRECAAALTAALPFLKRAHQVHAICADEDGLQSGRDELVKLARYLHLHGIDGVREHLSHTEDAGNTLLSLAADVGAELIVMGCYGHSRAREFVLGGVSRTLLETMTVPVLMAH